MQYILDFVQWNVIQDVGRVDLAEENLVRRQHHPALDPSDANCADYLPRELARLERLRLSRHCFVKFYNSLTDTHVVGLRILDGNHCCHLSRAGG